MKVPQLRLGYVRFTPFLTLTARIYCLLSDRNWPEAVVRPIEALGQLSRHQTLRSGLTQSRKLAVPTPEKSGGPEKTGRRDTVSALPAETAVRSP